MNDYKNMRVISVIILSILIMQNGVAQSNSNISKNEEKMVRKSIADFNRTLFLEKDLFKAIEKNVYLKKPDKFEENSIIEPEFYEISEEIPDKDKIRYYALQFYFLGGLHFLHWELGTDTISSSNKIPVFKIEMTKDFLNTWSQELKRNGITEERLEKAENDKNDLDFEELNYKILNTALIKHIDQKLLEKNLDFIEKHTTIKRMKYKGRVYYEVENQLFYYVVSVKNGSPKIMSLN